MLDDSVEAIPETSASVSVASQASAAPMLEENDAPRRLYGYGAERRSQPKTTDLLPKRWLAYSTVVVFLLAVVCCLNLMSMYAGSLEQYVGESGVAALSLEGSGTFASWFTTVLMTAGSLVCSQVYYLRKHRCDDYRGSYRLWFWAAASFLVGSVSSSVDLTSIVQHLSNFLAAEVSPIGGVSILTLVGCVLLGGLTAIGLWETRVSRGSMAFVLAGWLMGTVSILSTVPQVETTLAQVNLLIVTENAWLLFSTCAFLAVLTYARHVYLAANGMLPVRESIAKPAKVVAVKKAGKTASKRQPKTKVATKPEAAKPAPASSKINSKPAAKSESASNRMKQIREDAAAKKMAAKKAAPKVDQVPGNEADELGESPKLSKAERRRQRKLDRRQKRAA